MSRQAIAALCGALSVALLTVGCGGESAESAATKRLCPQVRSAEGRYLAARAALSIQVFNKSLELPARKAAEALLVEVQRLERSASSGQQAKLAPLAQALSNQVKTLRAFERHDLAEASKYGNSINAPLHQGLKDLAAICRKS